MSFVIATVMFVRMIADRVVSHSAARGLSSWYPELAAEGFLPVSMTSTAAAVNRATVQLTCTL